MPQTQLCSVPGCGKPATPSGRCAEHRMELRRTEKEAAVDKMWVTTYGVTFDEYNDLLDVQKGVCALCGTPNGLIVDMDSYEVTETVQDASGPRESVTMVTKTRGLLCNNCKRGLEYFRYNLDSLRAAVKYLTVVRP